MAKTDHDSLTDAGLEAFFDAARDAAPVPSEALMARIMADAEVEIIGRATPPAPAPRRGAFAAFAAALGGWPALAGLATATVAGVWLGFADPDGLNTLAGGLLLPDSAASASSYDLEDIVPGYGGFAALYEEG